MKFSKYPTVQTIKPEQNGSSNKSKNLRKIVFELWD